MNLNSNNVFRGALVSVYMAADDNDWLLIDNITEEPILIGSREDIVGEYDRINGFCEDVEG